MANELPYFRFVVQAWQNGKIDIERNELKGLFISICGYYWIQDCSLTLALLKKKFINDNKLIDELIELEILKHENRHDKVEIEFLDLQYDMLSEKRKSRQSAGSKGGNAKAKGKQKTSYKDKDNNKDNNKDKIIINELVFPFDSLQFMNLWNILITQPKWRKKTMEALQGNLKTMSEVSEPIALKMMQDALNNGWQGVFLPKNIESSVNGLKTSKIQEMSNAYETAKRNIENGNNND